LEAFITIIIIALAALSIGNGVKKVSQNRPGQGSNPDARPGQRSPYSPAQRPMRPVRPNWQQTLPPELREILGMDQQQPRREGAGTEAASSAEGAGSASEEGMSYGSHSSRYGGSLPPPEDSFATMSAVQATEPAPEFAPMPAAQEHAARMSPEELRRAVILSEVLKRPVSLRRRGYIR